MVLRIQKAPLPVTSPPPCGLTPNDDHLMTIIFSGKSSNHTTVSDFTDIPHGVMFLSLDVSSDDNADSVSIR